jgi:RNA polymerase sigma factor (sigma-70 family)
MSDTDLQLLARYTRDRAEDAFAELVRRHLDLVHSAALRQVRSPELAEEVAQSAFTDLAHHAARLQPDTILTSWLYQVTRRTAVDVVRRETRRQWREQIATEMNALNATTSDWTYIEPLLDEAMSALDATDRAAVLLRYFENKSLREVGAALGTSDAAAQKRVSRAVERLREYFAKGGINVGASGLVVVISANAVQAAPVGLALIISTAAVLAGTTIATTHLLQTMALTKTKLITAAIIAALSIPLALLWHQNASLRHEIAALRASAREASRPPDSITQSGKSGVNENELQQLRKEHLEVLSLRGRVTQLANELRRREVGEPSAGTSPNPASKPKDADSILFSASLTNRVVSGQTLVVGGWSMKGMRGYLLVTPVIRKGDDIPDGQPLAVQSQVIGAPESFWNEIGWDTAKSDMRRSTLAGVLTPEQADTLLKALKDTKGAEISNTSLAERSNGEYVGVGFGIADDQETGVLMGIDLYPRIAADGQSVDLEIRPSAVSTNTPIHPSLTLWLLRDDRRAYRYQCQIVVTAPGNVHRVGQAGGNVGLAEIAAAPGDDRFVGFQGESVMYARGNRHHVRHIRRNIGLVVSVVAPGDDRFVGLECQTELPAAGNRHHVREVRRHIGLAVIVLAPSDDRAVLLERQTVIRPRRHGNRVGQVRRDIGLAIDIVAPSDDGG